MLGGLYLYVFGVLWPPLLLHNQSPAFFARGAEFRRCLCSWPGGLTEYVSAGLTQTYVRASLGALIITLSIGLVCGLTDLLLHTVGGPRPRCMSGRYWPFLPLVFLLILLNHYTLPLGAVLSLAAAMLLACAYARLAVRRKSLRAVIALGMCAVLYAAAGAVSVLFACLCGLIELLVRRSAVTGAIIMIVGAALPYFAATYVYDIPVRDAFVRLTALEYDFSPPLASIALYACLPVGLILAARWPRGWAPAQRAAGTAAADTASGAPSESLVAWSLRTAALLLVAAVAAWLSFDSKRSAVLMIDYHARDRQWDQALAAARRLCWSGAVPGRRTEEDLAAICFCFHFPVDASTPAPLLPSWNVAIHDINLALAETGQLLDCMFQYPQRMGVSVVRLLPDDSGAYVAHSYNPDILLELGDVNEAERVTCECLANVGPRPWVLERLISVNVLKNRPQAARTCLNLMAGDPGRRAWADAFQQDLDKDPASAGRPVLQQVRSRMYRQDRVGHIGKMDPDEETLRYLLVANPHNRLAFDYLTAHYLLTLRNDKVAENMRHLGAFGYTRVPRHCEEALLLQARLAGNAAELRRFPIRPETVQRFDAFGRDLDQLRSLHGENKTAVRDALVGRYGDTYWFYAFFGDTFFRPERPVSTSRPGEGI